MRVQLVFTIFCCGWLGWKWIFFVLWTIVRVRFIVEDVLFHISCEELLYYTGDEPNILITSPQYFNKKSMATR